MFKKLKGIIGSIFQLGIGGPKLINNSNVVEVKNDAQDAFLKVKALPGAGTNEVLTHGQTGASFSGLDITTSALDMNNQQINNLGAPSLATDAVTKGYVDSAAITGGHLKEQLLHPSQVSDSAGILAAGSFVYGSSWVDDMTVIITDGTTTNTYTYKGTDPGAGEFNTRAGLMALINADSLADAVLCTTLTAIDANVVVITEASNAGAALKIYGTAGAQFKYIDYSAVTEYVGEAADLENLPAAAPTSSNFGLRRTAANLESGEFHSVNSTDVMYGWDNDADVWWTMYSPNSIPTATAASVTCWR